MSKKSSRRKLVLIQISLFLLIGLFRAELFANGQIPENSGLDGQKAPAQISSDQDSSKEIRTGTEHAEEIMPAYFFNIQKLIEEAEKNIEKIEQKKKQLEILERSQKREEAAEEMFERAESFFQEGKIDQAKKEWSKVLQITEDPRMKGLAREAKIKVRQEEIARQRKIKEKIDTLYREGVDYYRNDKLEKARESFAQILALDNENRRAEVYLQRRIPEKARRIEAAKERERQQQKRQEKIARQREIREKIDTLYREGVDYYRNDKLEKAKESFAQILALDNENRRAEVYLQRRIPEKARRIEEAKERDRQRRIDIIGRTLDRYE